MKSSSAELEKKLQPKIFAPIQKLPTKRHNSSPVQVDFFLHLKKM